MRITSSFSFVSSLQRDVYKRQEHLRNRKIRFGAYRLAVYGECEIIFAGDGEMNTEKLFGKKNLIIAAAIAAGIALIIAGGVLSSKENSGCLLYTSKSVWGHSKYVLSIPDSAAPITVPKRLISGMMKFISNSEFSPLNMAFACFTPVSYTHLCGISRHR